MYIFKLWVSTGDYLEKKLAKTNSHFVEIWCSRAATSRDYQSPRPLKARELETRQANSHEHTDWPMVSSQFDARSSYDAFYVIITVILFL